MKPGAPWSVKGIRPEARETAKSAARRAGMTLGEWLNQTIQDSDFDAGPVADPIRAPEDWKRETGEELPWTGPITAVSANIAERLTASEIRHTALLGSLESAIGGISQKLIALDKDRPGNDETAALDARLNTMEARQSQALSKDNLKSIETAVGSISAVLDGQANKSAAALKAQGTRIDRSQQAMANLASHLEQTEDRVSQALNAVEAASDLYDITDKQGRLIDSLVMDVAAVQAMQKTSDESQDNAIGALSRDFVDLRSDLETLAEQSQSGGEVEAEAIHAHITANEDRTAASIALIEEQITNLSTLLDRTLETRQNDQDNSDTPDDLSTGIEQILHRLSVLENAASPLPAPQQAPLISQAAPITFKSLPIQTSESVQVTMAVTLGENLTRSEPLPAENLDEESEDLEEESLREAPVIAERVETPAPPEPLVVESPLVDAVLEAPVDAPDDTTSNTAEIVVLSPPAADEPLLFGDTSSSFGELIDEAFGTPDKTEPTVFEHEDTRQAEANTEITASDTVDEEGADNEEDDAALREAVTNISTMRASWAARNEATGKTGSMRQIVDVDDHEPEGRNWPLAAAGFVVTLVAAGSLFVYASRTDDTADAPRRPGLFDQMTSWMPGRTPEGQPVETAQGSNNTSTVPGTFTAKDTLAVTLASLPAGLEEAAASGDAKAQFALGRALANGEGRPVDRALAIKWYKSAASQGLAIAQYVLASLHERGVDVEQDKKAAMDWYASAARGGNRRSMHNLAVAYARGDIINQNLSQAAYWFSEAARLGLSDAQYNLALLNERGLGVKKDLVAAIRWYRIAALGGDQAAMTQAIRLEDVLTPEQTQTASAFAQTWKPRDMNALANGLFDISPEAWDNAEQRRRLTSVQSWLQNRGFALETRDGIMDPATRSAISTFQGDNGLEVTGTVTPGLYESLTLPAAQ